MKQYDKLQLLTTFKLEDRLNLSYEEILWRAADCAARRAELYGWKDVETYLCGSKDHADCVEFEFEIWGVENENK